VNALGARIARLIATHGPLSIAEFMTIALHDPKDGYYATREPLGSDGDFVTAPEISQIFGELVGLWCVQVWRDQGSPASARLVELGPGRGTLMADTLRAAIPEFRESVEVVLVETSPLLRREQAMRLQTYDVRWVERFEDVPHDRPLFLIANEFFDALPIRQYVLREDSWHERVVVTDENGKLAFGVTNTALPPPINALLPPRAQAHSAPSPTKGGKVQSNAPLGAVREISPAAQALTGDIARIVAQAGGGALVIDYGYEKTGFGETLQAVGRHRFARVLDNPGAVDLSAHVDFQSLAHVAAVAGAKSFGPVTQAQFLEALGIKIRANILAQRNPTAAAAIADGVARLTDDAQMGTLFKALAILPPHAPPPPGF
jgi:SAM-dependent MidA family methyltransferase